MGEEIIEMRNNNAKLVTVEAYRTLRTNLQFLSVDSKIKSIVITSPKAGDGKSTIVSNLGMIMAQLNKKILLIDGDLRKPKLHKIFRVSNLRGLTNVLAEDGDYEKRIQYIATGYPYVLTSGPIPPNPSELLSSNKMKSVMDQLREAYDIILIDAPPVGLVTDAAILSTIVDGSILVVSAGKSHIQEAKEAKSALEKVNANLLGVVLNNVKVEKNDYDYGSYGASGD